MCKDERIRRGNQLERKRESPYMARAFPIQDGGWLWLQVQCWRKHRTSSAHAFFHAARPKSRRGAMPCQKGPKRYFRWLSQHGSIGNRLNKDTRHDIIIAMIEEEELENPMQQDPHGAESVTLLQEQRVSFISMLASPARASGGHAPRH